LVTDNFPELLSPVAGSCLKQIERKREIPSNQYSTSSIHAAQQRNKLDDENKFQRIIGLAITKKL
jgi:hypothetical protein